MKKAILIIGVFLFIGSIFSSKDVFAACEKQRPRTRCGTAGQRPQLCQNRLGGQTYCCDYANECKEPKTPAPCPAGYVKPPALDHCCETQPWVNFARCENQQPAGHYCPRNYQYNPDSGLCEIVIAAAPAGPQQYDPCWDKKKGDTIDSCVACLGGNGHELMANRPRSADFSWTALGCIPTNLTLFVAWFLTKAIGVGGGIAFLLMLWAGFQIMTSSGNPEKLNKGKGVLTSAITGLLFIVFSVLLLRIIGVDIFKLPGLNP